MKIFYQYVKYVKMKDTLFFRVTSHNLLISLLGIGIYDLASLINHDCTPNCVAVFQGAKVLIRSIKTISKNDEVTISYIESLETRYNRIKELKDRYFFQCTCNTCSKESEFDGLIIGKCQNEQCCSTVLVNKCGK